MRLRAIPDFFVLRPQQLVSHRVDERHRHIPVIQRPADALDVSVSLHQVHGVDLPEAVRADVLRQPKRALRALYVCPHRLPRPVLPPVVPALEHPDLTRLAAQLAQQLGRKPDAPTLAGLLLCNPELRPQLRGPQRQNVADSQPRV